MSRTSFWVNLHSIPCLNVKELLARSRGHIRSLSDSNGIRTHNHLVRKRTFNHLPKPVNWDSKKALNRVLLLLEENNFAILERALNFWLALLQSFRACLSNFRSLSIVIPRSLTSHRYFPRLNLSLYSPVVVDACNPKLSDGIYLCLISYKYFKPTSSNHRFFLKRFQNILYTFIRNICSSIISKITYVYIF